MSPGLTGMNPLGGAGMTPEPDMIDQLEQRFHVTKAKYAKLLNARSQLDKVRKELTELTKLGDTISEDDVVKAAGALVGHGLGAEAVAGILADMPSDGQGLAAWIGKHAAEVTQREEQLEQVVSQFRHELGVQGLQFLAGQEKVDKMAGLSSPQQMESPENPLMAPNAEMPPMMEEQAMPAPLMTNPLGGSLDAN